MPLLWRGQQRPCLRNVLRTRYALASYSWCAVYFAGLPPAYTSAVDRVPPQLADLARGHAEAPQLRGRLGAGERAAAARQLADRGGELRQPAPAGVGRGHGLMPGLLPPEQLVELREAAEGPGRWRGSKTVSPSGRPWWRG
jgi:hypothetical protein